ncbi:11147_t:CDS:1, partial [Dentiscutata heterogama]
QNLGAIFYSPTTSKTDNGDIRFQCHTGTYYDEVSHSSIISQLSSITAIAGLIINIAFYGVTSKLHLKTTCILDDLLILTFFLTPIFSWFFTVKPAWFFFNASMT